uniref:Uncharacterized protein n=1 Tax=Anopheles melas TaxID=34690 RepID=A0A182TYJ5_9DIPT
MSNFYEGYNEHVEDMINMPKRGECPITPRMIYVVSTQLFHSPLGNQQFNHYPMKLPTHQLCDFVDMLHDEYGEYLVNVYNMPERGIDYERAEQLSGFDMVNTTLRVRKYNRTTKVLNGTTASTTILNNSFLISTDIFHSPLGNQQFNHYPMKLPSKPLCDFLDMIYAEYSDCLENIYNLPERGTCPILPLEVHTIDKVFPAKSIPPFVPKGLWKAFIIFTLHDEEVVRLMWMIKYVTTTFPFSRAVTSAFQSPLGITCDTTSCGKAKSIISTVRGEIGHSPIAGRLVIDFVCFP